MQREQHRRIQFLRRSHGTLEEDSNRAWGMWDSALCAGRAAAGGGVVFEGKGRLGERHKWTNACVLFPPNANEHFQIVPENQMKTNACVILLDQ